MLADLAAALSDALDRETAALRHGDYDAAARLAPAKLAAVNAFTEAAAQAAAAPLPADPEPEGLPSPEPGLAAPRDVLERLREAAQANSLALEAALAVQGRIVELVTGALSAKAGAPVGYGSPAPAPAPPVSFVLSVKA